MSKTAKIMLIIFIIALAVIVYFIMFGNKNDEATTTGATLPTTTGTSPLLLRIAGGVLDPAQRYIGSGRPGITPTAN
jgi:flagellar basal body-associated protein FliL